MSGGAPGGRVPAGARRCNTEFHSNGESDRCRGLPGRAESFAFQLPGGGVPVTIRRMYQPRWGTREAWASDATWIAAV
jgi:hypothetical protein